MPQRRRASDLMSMVADASETTGINPVKHLPTAQKPRGRGQIDMHITVTKVRAPHMRLSGGLYRTHGRTERKNLSDTWRYFIGFVSHRNNALRTSLVSFLKQTIKGPM